MMGVVKSYLNENSIDLADFNIKPKFIAELSDMVKSGEINHSIINQKIFPAMLNEIEKSPKEIAKENNWIQSKNDDLLKVYVMDSLKKYPEKVLAYKNGNKNLLGLFMGEAMKLSKGTANPKILNELIKKELES